MKKAQAKSKTQPKTKRAGRAKQGRAPDADSSRSIISAASTSISRTGIRPPILALQEVLSCLGLSSSARFPVPARVSVFFSSAPPIRLGRRAYSFTYTAVLRPFSHRAVSPTLIYGASRRCLTFYIPAGPVSNSLDKVRLPY